MKPRAMGDWGVGGLLIDRAIIPSTERTIETESELAVDIGGNSY